MTAAHNAAPGARFRAAVAAERPLQVVGAINALTARMAAACGFKALYLSGGGVAANSELREALPGAALAPLPLCTDNAAMIASAARFEEPVAYPGYLGLDAYASR